ncbi:MAG: phosphoglycerate mutase family protein [Lachnospiraceae bacterium]|jgi:probable phosphoglycerate mutase|nr:phosphoglycerate mutase family protein [Lachnospiraceae bacterium]
MKTIITIQHTQSVQHTSGMVGSWTDWELTDLGKQYAENIGQRLGAELAGKPCKIYCSDLTRTRQTVEPLARVLDLTIDYRKELREINLGSACGKTKQWMWDHQSQVVTVDDRRLPDAETGREVWNRLSAFCDEITVSDDELIVIVSHTYALEMWLAIWLRWDIEMLGKSKFIGQPGGVSFMRENDGGKRVLMKLNDMSYSGCEVRFV